MAHVVALVPDLLFGSKLQAMLAAEGHDVEMCVDEALARAKGPEADLLIVDLTSDDIDGPTLVESMRLGHELGETRTLGFYAHVDQHTRQRADEAGFDLVVPRSRMAREGAGLVARLTAGVGNG
jgi:CheY-like chemotaxis protein